MSKKNVPTENEVEGYRRVMQDKPAVTLGEELLSPRQKLRELSSGGRLAEGHKAQDRMNKIRNDARRSGSKGK